MVYTSHSTKVGYYSIIKELVRETILTSIRIKGYKDIVLNTKVGMKYTYDERKYRKT